jgi:nicotinamidase-related amidase
MKEWNVIGKPALLILHMQQGMLTRGSDRRKSVEDSGIIPNQQSLLQTFREKKLPIIFVNVMRRPPVTDNLPIYGRVWVEASSLKVDPAEMMVIPELTPLPGEPVLINLPVAAFNNSGLENMLRLYRVETLVLAGYATNGVVYGTTVGAADRFFNVIVPRDASTSASAEAHRVVMDIMAPSYALVTTTRDSINHLR